MIYISAQPATIYFAWQLNVMLYSFKNNNVNLNDVHVVCAVDKTGLPHKQYDILQKKYKSANFYFYKDTRKDKSYKPSVGPHILKKHFKKNDWLVNETIFYHDSDIALTQELLINENYLKDDVCYLSNCNRYLDFSYIKSIDKNLLDIMTDTLNIKKEILIKNQNNSGGAQHILKNIDYLFWEKVEKDSLLLYNKLKKIKQQAPFKYKKLKVWVAGMWALLWNLWGMERKTKIIKELDFCWPVSDKSEWDKKFIYHDAGVTPSMFESGYFYKQNYKNKLPDLNLKDPPNCSKLYYELIKNASK